MNEITIMSISIMALTFIALRLYGKLRNKEQFLADMVRSRDYHEERAEELKEQLSRTHKSLTEAIIKFDSEVVENGRLKTQIERLRKLMQINPETDLYFMVTNKIEPKKFVFDLSFDTRREARTMTNETLKKVAGQKLADDLGKIINFEIVDEEDRPIKRVQAEFYFYQLPKQ